MTTIAVALMLTVVMIFTGVAHATTITDYSVGMFETFTISITYAGATEPAYTETIACCAPEPVVWASATGDSVLPYIGLEDPPAVATVPEPGTLLLLLAALMAYAVLLRRRASRPSVCR